MKVEGVTFILKVCSKMTKDEFISRHVDHIWQDKDKKVRKKMLADTYDVINPPKTKPKAEEE